MYVDVYGDLLSKLGSLWVRLRVRYCCGGVLRPGFASTLRGLCAFVGFSLSSLVCCVRGFC